MRLFVIASTKSVSAAFLLACSCYKHDQIEVVAIVNKFDRISASLITIWASRYFLYLIIGWSGPASYIVYVPDLIKIVSACGC